MKKLIAAWEKVAGRLPATLAGRIDLLSPSHAHAWGGPMNGQERRQDVVRELSSSIDFSSIVETGTFRGTTTEFLAAVFGVNVYTVEGSRRYYTYSKRRLGWLSRVHVEHGDSREFLRRLAADPAVAKDAPTFFYLDAHWHADLPLAEELRLIAKYWSSAVVMIDDFQIPGDDGYTYDDYGLGKALVRDYLPEDALTAWHLYYPAATSQEETGLRRGCCVLLAPGLAGDGASLKSLRSVGSLGPASSPRSQN